MHLSPTRDDNARSPIERLLRFLERIATSSFFGEVVVTFQNGRVVTISTKQSLKLDDL